MKCVFEVNPMKIVGIGNLTLSRQSGGKCLKSCLPENWKWYWLPSTLRTARVTRPPLEEISGSFAVVTSSYGSVSNTLQNLGAVIVDFPVGASELHRGGRRERRTGYISDTELANEFGADEIRNDVVLRNVHFKKVNRLKSNRQVDVINRVRQRLPRFASQCCV